MGKKGKFWKGESSEGEGWKVERYDKSVEEKG